MADFQNEIPEAIIRLRWGVHRVFTIHGANDSSGHKDIATLMNGPF